MNGYCDFSNSPIIVDISKLAKVKTPTFIDINFYFGISLNIPQEKVKAVIN